MAQKKKKRVPKKNPLNAQVTSAINAQISPFQQGIRQANDLFNQDSANIGKVGTALQGELSSIGQQISNRSGDLLNLAASRNTAQGQELNANQDFLRSILSNYSYGGVDNTADGMELAQGQARLGNVGNATGLAFGAQSLGRDQQMLQGSVSARRQEDIQKALMARNERQKQLNDEINRIKATRPFLARQFRSENLTDRLKLEELNLSKSQAAEQARQFDAGLDAAAMASGGGGGGGSAGGGGGGNAAFNKKIDEIHQAYLARTTNTRDKDGNVVKAEIQKGARTGAAYDMLTSRGINPKAAAWYAILWSGRRYHQNRGPVKTYKYLSRLGIPPVAMKHVIEKLWGDRGWKKAIGYKEL